VIDAVGQHAGMLQVAGPGTGGALNITDGWIQIENELDVGTYTTFNASGSPVVNVGAGAVNQTGGLVAIGQTLFLGGPSGASGVYNLSGGVLSVHQIVKGAAGGAFNFTGGVLHADEIGFDLVNQGGTLAPGNSPGRTHVAGSLTLQSGSVQIELASLSQFDQISVDGLFTLGGALDVLLLDGYRPAPNDRWPILTGANLAGSFASMTDGFTVERQGGTLFLVAVPEPTSVGIISLAVAGCLSGRRSRRYHA
jgi:hypothetical protein